MLSLTDLQASVTDLTAKVRRATSVEAGVALTVQTIVQQNKDLEAQIAGLNPQTITQADLDAIKQQIADSAAALSDGTEALAAATANVPPAPGNAASGGTVADPIPGSGLLMGGRRGAQSGMGAGSGGSGQSYGADAPDKLKPIAGTSAEDRAEAQRAADEAEAADRKAATKAVEERARQEGDSGRDQR